jgi:hypothetical protein
VTRAQLERRVARIEGAVARLVSRAALPDFDLAEMPRWLTFNEIVQGQAAAARYDGDPQAALDQNDPLFVMLVATASARHAGVTVADLFPEVR